MSDVDGAVARILDVRARLPASESALVALSGIDGSGKGYLAARIVDGLLARGLNAANVNLDLWLNLPERRFSAERPAEQFYERGLRFDELFGQLILPLKRQRSLQVTVDAAFETATAYHRHTYAY